jgi:mRNA guanylyltransferase
MRSKLPHVSDGLIFTAVNKPYRGGRQDSILKYKQGADNTLDFAVYLTDEGLSLYCAKKGIDCIYFGLADGTKKPEIVKELHREKKTIVECIYSASINKWELFRIRKDKNTANDIKIVNWVIESLNDNLTFEHLSLYCRNESNAIYKSKKD